MAKPLKWALNKIKSLNEAIWHTAPSEISRRKLFLFKQLRIIIVAARGFMRDKVQIRASALTFYSLISLIPLAAIAFAIAKGFGLDQNLEQILSNFISQIQILDKQAQQDILKWLLSLTTNAIEKTRGGYIAGVGVIILFWSVMSLLDHIESSFNHIWQIRSSRPWYRKFTDYLTIMLIAPVFIILSGSITVFVGTELADYIAKAPILDFFKPVISFLVKFSPYFLSWVVLTILFMIIPNTKVKFLPAFVSGIIAGTTLQILRWLYIDLQFGISKLSTIYGGFVAFPLFIIWLQSSWIIVLLGAELSFANQNVSRYEFESEALNISNYQKRALILLIMNLIVCNFARGKKPFSAERIAGTLKIPVRIARDILQDLNSVDLVSIIHINEHKEWLYQPALDINKLTVSFILSRLDKKGIEQYTIIKNKDYNKITGMLDKFDKMIAKSGSNVLIKNLL